MSKPSLKDRWILSAKNIACVYDGSEGGFQAGVSIDELQIPSVGITVILGDSGSGKSTLLGLLTGLKKANAFGDPSHLSILKKNDELISLLNVGNIPPGEISFVFQDSQLVQTVTANKNAALGCVISQESNYSGKLDRLFDSVSISGKYHSQAAKLSGGQAQRTAIIRALAVDAGLLVCDEPTSSLDSRMSESVMLEIQKWASDNNSAVLWVTHDLKLAACYADYAIYVANGQLVLDGKHPIELQDNNEESYNQLLKIKSDNPSSTTNKNDVSNEQHEINSSSPQYTDKGVAKYLSIFAWEDLTESLAVGGNPLKYLFLLCFSFLKKSVVWFAILGFIIVYGVNTLSSASEKYFTKSLSQPEVTHFLIESSSSQDLSDQFVETIKEGLAKVVKKDLAGKVFGRRSLLITEVWLAKTSDCTLKAKSRNQRVFNESIRVFNDRDVLYSALSKPGVNDDPVLIVTEQFAHKLGISGLDSEIYLCVDLHGPKKAKVSNIVGKIPSGGKSNFNLALSDEHYKDLLDSNESEEFPTDSSYPNYQEIAVYFEANDVSAVKCAFDSKNKYGCPLDSPALFSGLIQDDSIVGVEKLINTSKAASTLLTALEWILLLTIALSTGIAVSSYVKQNEKPMALMKAFGYKLHHIIFLLCAQLGYMFIFCVVIFSIILFICESRFVMYFATSFRIPVSWISFEPLRFVESVSVVMGIILFTYVLVVYFWWVFKAKYLGKILQAN